METAGWTADWYRAVTRTSDDTRTYLVMSAAGPWTARWYRSIMAWDDTSGYGAVEANRAANASAADVPPRPVEMTGKESAGLASSSAFGPRDDPRTALLLTSTRSRERGQTGVRSSALFWATTKLRSEDSEDLASAASRP
jgi:hypothetical protein